MTKTRCMRTQFEHRSHCFDIFIRFRVAAFGVSASAGTNGRRPSGLPTRSRRLRSSNSSARSSSNGAMSRLSSLASSILHEQRRDRHRRARITNQLERFLANRDVWICLCFHACVFTCRSSTDPVRVAGTSVSAPARETSLTTSVQPRPGTGGRDADLGCSVVPKACPASADAGRSLLGHRPQAWEPNYVGVILKSSAGRPSVAQRDFGASNRRCQCGEIRGSVWSIRTGRFRVARKRNRQPAPTNVA